MDVVVDGVNLDLILIGGEYNLDLSLMKYYGKKNLFGESVLYVYVSVKVFAILKFCEFKII